MNQNDKKLMKVAKEVLDFLDEEIIANYDIYAMYLDLKEAIKNKEQEAESIAT